MVPWSIALLDKFKIPQMVKKFFALFGDRKV
jgi:hypothetical protein